MLLLREFINGELKEERSLLISETLTIGRAKFADVQIGESLHPVIHRCISRIQATVRKDHDETFSITDGSDEQPSAGGIWYKGRRIDYQILESGQSIALFQWECMKEPIESVSSVRYELTLDDRAEPPTNPSHLQQIRDRLNSLTKTVEGLGQLIEEHRENFAGLEERIESKIELKIDEKVTAQIGEIRDRLEEQRELDLKQSADIARVVRQTRLVSVVITCVVGTSILLTGIQDAGDRRGNWVDFVRAALPIVGGAFLVIKLSRKKQK